MSSEREKMLAGELYDPLDPELVAARDRARDLCQDLNATREGEQRRAAAHPARALRQRRRHRLDAAAVLLRLRLEHPARRARLLQLQLRRARRVPGADRRLHAVRPGRADLHAAAPAERRVCGGGRSSASRSRSARTCGSAAGRSSCPACGSARVRSSAPAAWSRGTSRRACSPPATPAASSARSRSERELRPGAKSRSPSPIIYGHDPATSTAGDRSWRSSRRCATPHRPRAAIARAGGFRSVNRQARPRSEPADRRGVHEEDPGRHDRDVLPVAAGRLPAGVEDGADAEGRPRRHRRREGQAAVLEGGLRVHAAAREVDARA